MNSNSGTRDEGSSAAAGTVADEETRHRLEEADGTTTSVPSAESVRERGHDDAARLETRRAPRYRLRNTALGLVVVGAGAIAAAVIFPSVRTVLLVLGAIGLFGGVLTYFLPDGRYISASIGSQIYAATASNQSRLAATLNLRDRYVYVPSRDTVGTPAWLFVPEHNDFDVPDPDRLADLFITSVNDRKRGISLVPASALLFDEFRAVTAGKPATQTPMLGEQIAAALVDAFDLADEVTIDAAASKLTATVSGSAYADPAEFDHPIPSLFGVALSAQLGTPVEVSTRSVDDEDRIVVSCRWGSALETDAP